VIGTDGWWQSGVLYQVYPRSFADSDNDGIGDLRGIVDHLDHLAWLGVDGVGLSPTMPSPNADWGYDVADYCDVSADYGTLEDMDALIREAAGRGMAILLDLVPNHSSDQHRWFVDARSAKAAEHRDWYVWADPKADGSPPNNWVSSFGGPAWTQDEATGQYYLHNFLPEQPDLNWWNDQVRDAFDSILRFWFDRGVAGFRIDVANMVIKDAELRDNPLATSEDHWLVQVFGQRSVYNSNRPEVHDILARWRRIAESYQPPRVLVGETNVDELDTLVSFYGNGTDELHLAFNFVFIETAFQADRLRAIVEGTEARLPAGAWPVWTGSNHDVSRFASRWADGDPVRARLALLILLTLRGTPVLYQGDEIGLPDTVLTRDDILDPVGTRFWPAYAGRDPMRTPMQWRNQPGGGFTHPDTRPWLPVGDVSAYNVEAQRSDRHSMLVLCRDLIALRRATPDLHGGAYQSLSSPPDVWTWRRGHHVTVAINVSDTERIATIPDGAGHIAIATDRHRDEEIVSGPLRLGPWGGAVLLHP
jgi:alpha-glucosidase